MNWLDILILIPLVGGIFSGYKNGLIGEVASLAGLILGIWGAIKFSDYTAGIIGSLGLESAHMPLISFIITFLIITIVMQMLAALISKLLDSLLLGWVNRLFGMVAGVIKGVLFVGVVLFVLDALDNKRTLIPPAVKENSLLYEDMASLVPTLLPFLHLDELLKSPDGDADPAVRS